jgi:hypothetical protein
VSVVLSDSDLRKPAAANRPLTELTEQHAHGRRCELRRARWRTAESLYRIHTRE